MISIFGFNDPKYPRTDNISRNLAKTSLIVLYFISCTESSVWRSLTRFDKRNVQKSRTKSDNYEKSKKDRVNLLC